MRCPTRLLRCILRSRNRTDINFDNFEALLRALLSYPKKPAVVVLQTVKINSPIRYGAEHQFGLCGYYDVP